jgi:hypothetical protein
MLELRKKALVLDGKELREMEHIVARGDEIEALRFLKKSVYDQVARFRN